MGWCEEHDGMRRLLQESIAMLCRNGISFRHCLRVEGLIGITVDEEQVFLVSVHTQDDKERLPSQTETTTAHTQNEYGNKNLDLRVPGSTESSTSKGVKRLHAEDSVMSGSKRHMKSEISMPTQICKKESNSGLKLASSCFTQIRPENYKMKKHSDSLVPDNANSCEIVKQEVVLLSDDEEEDMSDPGGRGSVTQATGRQGSGGSVTEATSRQGVGGSALEATSRHAGGGSALEATSRQAGGGSVTEASSRQGCWEQCTDLPFQTSVPSHSSSLSQNSLPTDSMFDVSCWEEADGSPFWPVADSGNSGATVVTYINGGMNKHCKAICQGFVFTKNREKGSRIYWRCRDRRCHSRMVTHNGVLLTPPSPHECQNLSPLEDTNTQDTAARKIGNSLDMSVLSAYRSLQENMISSWKKQTLFNSSLWDGSPYMHVSELTMIIVYDCFVKFPVVFKCRN